MPGMGPGMMPGMQQMQPGTMMGVPPTDPMSLQARFQQIDTDHSGNITVQEIYHAYAQMQFSPQAAKLLLQAVSDLPYITMQNFPLFDMHLSHFWASFTAISQGRPVVMPQQILQGLQMLNFRFDPNVAMALINKFDLDKQGVSFGEYMSICSYFLICNRLMQKFDTQRRGFLQLDYNGLTSLGMWFL